MPLRIDEPAAPVSKRRRRQQQQWNLKKAEWDKFTALVEENIPRHYAAKNLNKVDKLLRKAIIKGLYPPQNKFSCYEGSSWLTGGSGAQKKNFRKIFDFDEIDHPPGGPGHVSEKK